MENPKRASARLLGLTFTSLLLCFPIMVILKHLPFLACVIVFGFTTISWNSLISWSFLNQNVEVSSDEQSKKLLMKLLAPLFFLILVMIVIIFLTNGKEFDAIFFMLSTFLGLVFGFGLFLFDKLDFRPKHLRGESKV